MKNLLKIRFPIEWRNFSLLLKAIIFSIVIISTAFIFDKTINKESVIQAENIIGLNFSDAKRDSLIESLNAHLKNYQNIRKAYLSNDIPPSLLFNPAPPGFRIPSKQFHIEFSKYTNLALPVYEEDLAWYSIGQLAELIKTKRVSCLALTKFYLQRLKKYSPKLQCVVTLTEDYALRRAADLDKELAAGKYRGTLHGIPYGLKDLFAVKGYPTTWGAVPFKGQVIDYNSTVFNKLEAAGGVLLAKLTMGELAMGDVWFGGMTRNPWDITQGSSGSSAGSASSVSAGLLPFAIGTETWGSIVSPSTICGVTGFRPSFGRVSRAGAMALSWSMDKVGPICRSAEDCAIVFDVIRGQDNIDPNTVNAPFNYYSKLNLKKLRVGYLKLNFAKNYDLKDNDSLTLNKLQQMGFNLTPVEFNSDIPLQDLSIILEAEAGAAFDLLTRNGDDDKMVKQTKDSWPNIFRASRFIPAVEYINANRLRTKLVCQLNQIMQKFDVLVVPSLEDDTQLLFNLTGHPCIAFPNGFTSKGMPTSISFVGNLYDEGIILSAANQFQKVTNFNKKHPPLNW
ncbi:MAG: amidase [Ignavibacteriaceae bacterium]|nr:amidase [Ignavibacteriaceae bacterium]